MFQKKEENSYSSGSESNHSTGQTIVGQSVKLEGDFSSDENVRIDGAVSGTLKTSKNLEIGQGAVVEADVFAENATIAGRVSGNIDVKEKLDLTDTAKITGDIKTGIFSVAPGAVFTGQCSMSGEEKTSVDAVTKDETQE